jgi:hypothetical protein
MSVGNAVKGGSVLNMTGDSFLMDTQMAVLTEKTITMHDASSAVG